MTIAIASGKGGTGKTTLAVHLASRLGALASTVLADLDVEAPDALSYFPGASAGQSGAVTIQVAQAVDGSCDSCGRCASVCRFGAIVAIGGSVSVNPQLCKGCGRCMRACPDRKSVV